MKKYSLIKNGYIDLNLVYEKPSKVSPIELRFWNNKTYEGATYGYISKQVARHLDTNICGTCFNLFGHLVRIDLIASIYSIYTQAITIQYTQIH